MDINPWILKKIVLPQNTDQSGVMWHGSYISWLEEARINALGEVGLSYAEMSSGGFEMPVVDLQIKYLVPLFHGECIFLKTWVYKGKGPRWVWETQFFKDSILLALEGCVLIHSGGS